jgi:hypothetical protein
MGKSSYRTRKQSALGIGVMAFRDADTPATVEDFDLQFKSPIDFTDMLATIRII